MAAPIGIASALLALVGEALLVAALVLLWRAARRLDDPRPARWLLVAAPLVAVTAVLRIARYATGTFGSVDTIFALVAGVVAWAFAWRAVLALPDAPRAAASAGAVLVSTAAASALLQAGQPVGFVIQLMLGLAFGLTGATVAALGWRLRADGVGGIVPVLAVAAGLVAVVGVWARAFTAVAAQAGDTTMFSVARLVLAATSLLVALFAWPALDAVVARLAARRAP